MLRIYQQKLPTTHGCTRGISRRNFLQFGSGLAGLTLADILRADAGVSSDHKKKIGHCVLDAWGYESAGHLRHEAGCPE